jgi:hydroxyquinol 1,2-dioxygenase
MSRDVNQFTVTDAVKASFKDRSNERLAMLLDKLVEHLHDYARETNLTQQEWLAALNFLYDCGKISTPDRHEFILLSDVLGFSACVDLVNTKGGGTEISNLGPFYLGDAPEKALGADLAGDREGVVLLASGVVKDTLGHPIAGATVDTWQSDGAGMYPIQDPKQDKYDLRGKFTTDEKGRYYYTTVLPKAYTVPYDGPVGTLLKATKRHAWRTKHLHYMLYAEGQRSLITEVFFEGDEYLDSDAVFGVRKALIREPKRVPKDAKLEFELERRPDARMDFDFVLAPAG